MISIAIDGPNGVGKSTIAKAISKKFGYYHVDSGAFYRAVALYNIELYGKIEESRSIKSLKDIKIELNIIDSIQHLILNRRDVTKEIRRNDISMAASDISKYIEVREFVNSLLVHFINSQNIIIDGRDIGTTVMPNATLKIFLTADVKERATRRRNDLLSKGTDIPYDTVLEEIIARDTQDSTRTHSPLKKAKDAIEVDSTKYDINQTVEHISKIILEKIGK